MTSTVRASDAPGRSLAVWLNRALLAASLVLFALHFVHLNADFPNHSPWVDWSKYTDEGWYGDAAIRHYDTGHWYWKGDFNPAVALPVWPLIEALVFRFSGVSLAAARATALCMFGITNAGFYFLLRKFARVWRKDSGPSLAPALCVFLLCASPFFLVFSRLAILEPPLIAFTVLAMLAASSLHRSPPVRRGDHGGESGAAAVRVRGGVVRWMPSLALGLLLPAIVLTKTPGLFLFPAIFYLVWARAGYRVRPALRMAVPPAVLGLVLWAGYMLLLVRPHYMEDYRYLFSANAYTGILLDPFEKVVINTFAGGLWMGNSLYIAFYVVLALMVFWLPRMLRNPLLPALLLWAGGYAVFLAYHNNLQPRYFVVTAAPITAVVALGLDAFRQAVPRRWQQLSGYGLMIVLVNLALPSVLYEWQIIAHPTYTFEAAAQSIARMVRADKTHSPLILSISGSDLTLMTGLPSIDDDFGTWELGERARFYRPGWYVAWNELDDDKMDALTPEFRAVRVAAFPALDDPDRNLLILYRLDQPGASDVGAPVKARHAVRKMPKPLVTRMGEQPTTEQLEH